MSQLSIYGILDEKFHMKKSPFRHKSEHIFCDIWYDF